MNWNFSLLTEIDLYIEGRISENDAKRQHETAAELLNRLITTPGQILGDEVGMGKTYVALAVAISVAMQDNKKRPVVIVMPPGLMNKWETEINKFKERCLPLEYRKMLKCAKAIDQVQFLNYTSTPDIERPNLILLKNTALAKNLPPDIIQLAIIHRALFRRKDPEGKLKKRLSRVLNELIKIAGSRKCHDSLMLLLLKSSPDMWRDILFKNGLFLSGADSNIPGNIFEQLYGKGMSSEDFEDLFKLLLNQAPQRHSVSMDARIGTFQAQLKDKIKPIWKKLLNQIEYSGSLPLLVLDEAHHVKNKDTRLARQFTKLMDSDDEYIDGQLCNRFERMLFLTATPFELGHEELCNILERFGGVHWRSFGNQHEEESQFKEHIKKMRRLLDATYAAGKQFDQSWRKLSWDDIGATDNSLMAVEQWWNALQENSNSEVVINHSSLLEKYNTLKGQMREAEKILSIYILRNLRSRSLSGEYAGIARRILLPGAGILDDSQNDRSGLPVNEAALLPFLLAARLSSLKPESRPVFAEGLASSYDAFLETSKSKAKEKLTDEYGEEKVVRPETDKREKKYLTEMEAYVSKLKKGVGHPKMEATVNKVMDLWRRGEKVLVFCHYRATTTALHKSLSVAMKQWIEKEAAKKMRCSTSEVKIRLRKLGDQFDAKRMGRRVLEQRLTIAMKDFPALHQNKDDILKVLIKYFRTPGFLVRYFPLSEKGPIAKQVEKAFAQTDNSGLSLYQVVLNFLKFLSGHCGETERQNYINALESLFSGEIRYNRLKYDTASGAEQYDKILPNVARVDGDTDADRRRKIMLTFNTPFFPEVLVTSNVMAEGVDLHLHCRYIIHHDLSWNPSMLEQRTGRVDRIGAKAEHCGQPIHVYHPYVGETQDEKKYKTVTERARWFSILMNAEYKTEWLETERIASSVPLPESIVKDLAFNLGGGKNDQQSD